MKRKYLLILLIVFAVIAITGCKKDNKTKLVENVDYFVKAESETGGKKERGYYIDTTNEPNAAYYYVICMGEKSTGGYSLKIKEVYKIDNKTEVIVEEISPGKDDVVTMAFTSPRITVEFPKYQENIIIKNTEGEEFNKLED